MLEEKKIENPDITTLKSKKINIETASTIVYNDLKEMILSGQIPQDYKLPSENKLAETYGVSRVTIRTVLQKLSNFGLVETKPGEGSYVKEVSFQNMLAEFSELIARESMLVYLEEFRHYIENACTELFIDNASLDEINELSRRADILMECANNRDAQCFIINDYKFHYYLAYGSHNKIFELVYSSIKDIFYKCILENISEIQKTDINYLKHSASAHKVLVDQIKKKNKKEALSTINIIVSHFDYNNSEITNIVK